MARSRRTLALVSRMLLGNIGLLWVFGAVPAPQALRRAASVLASR